MKIIRPTVQQVAEGFIAKHIVDGDDFFFELENHLKNYFAEAQAGYGEPVHSNGGCHLECRINKTYLSAKNNYGLNLHRTLESALQMCIEAAVNREGYPDVTVDVLFDAAKEVMRVRLTTHYPFAVQG